MLTCVANLVLKAVTSVSRAHTSSLEDAPRGMTSGKQSEAVAEKRAGGPWWKVGDELSEPSRTSPALESSQTGPAEAVEVREPEDDSRGRGRGAKETCCKEAN